MTDDIIRERMDGNIVGSSIDDAIKWYRFHPHIDYEFDGGCICITIHEEYNYIAFAWCENDIKSKRNFLLKTQEIYNNSTKPFIYTGKKNYFNSRSIEISPNIWQCSPKVV